MGSFVDVGGVCGASDGLQFLVGLGMCLVKSAIFILFEVEDVEMLVELVQWPGEFMKPGLRKPRFCLSQHMAHFQGRFGSRIDKSAFDGGLDESIVLEDDFGAFCQPRAGYSAKFCLQFLGYWPDFLVFDVKTHFFMLIDREKLVTIPQKADLERFDIIKPSFIRIPEDLQPPEVQV